MKKAKGKKKSSKGKKKVSRSSKKRAEYPLVSFVIVNYNGMAYLKKCFDSILKQKYPQRRIEIIMIDNGSSDESISFVKKAYPKIRIVRNKDNNYCKANNLGIKRAKGELIATVNTDVILDKNWLIRLIKEMKTDKKEKICGVGGKIYFLNGLIQSAGQVMTPEHIWKDIGYMQKEKGRYNKRKTMISLNGAAVLYRKKCLEELGGFDKDYVMYYDEADLGLRCKKKGLKMVYVPGAVAHHKVKGTATKEVFEYYFERNKLLLLAKHAPHILRERIPKSKFIINTKSSLLKKELSLILRAAGFDRKMNQYLTDAIVNTKKHVEEEITTEKDKMIDYKSRMVEDKKRIIKEKEELIQKTEGVLQKLYREKEEVIEKLKKTNQKADQVRKERDEKIDQLEKQNKNKEKNIQKLHKEKEGIIQQLKQITQKVNRLRKEKDEKIDQLEKQNKNKEKNIQDLYNEKEDLIKQVKQINQKLNRLRRYKDERISQIREKKQKEINNLLKEIEKTKKQKDKEINNLLKEIEKTKKQKDREIKRQRTLNQQKKDELIRLSRWIEAAKKELAWRRETLESIYNSRLYKYVGKHVWDIHNRLIGKKRKSNKKR